MQVLPPVSLLTQIGLELWFQRSFWNRICYCMLCPSYLISTWIFTTDRFICFMQVSRKIGKYYPKIIRAIERKSERINKMDREYQRPNFFASAIANGRIFVSLSYCKLFVHSMRLSKYNDSPTVYSYSNGWSDTHENSYQSIVWYVTIVQLTGTDGATSQDMLDIFFPKGTSTVQSTVKSLPRNIPRSWSSLTVRSLKGIASEYNIFNFHTRFFSRIRKGPHNDLLARITGMLKLTYNL